MRLLPMTRLKGSFCDRTDAHTCENSLAFHHMETNSTDVHGGKILEEKASLLVDFKGGTSDRPIWFLSSGYDGAKEGKSCS